MPSRNRLSHRVQHRQVRQQVERVFETSLGRRPTGAEYRAVRRDVARQRREEQAEARRAEITATGRTWLPQHSPRRKTSLARIRTMLRRMGGRP